MFAKHDNPLYDKLLVQVFPRVAQHLTGVTRAFDRLRANSARNGGTRQTEYHQDSGSSHRSKIPFFWRFQNTYPTARITAIIPGSLEAAVVYDSVIDGFRVRVGCRVAGVVVVNPPQSGRTRNAVGPVNTKDRMNELVNHRVSR